MNILEFFKNEFPDIPEIIIKYCIVLCKKYNMSEYDMIKYCEFLLEDSLFVNNFLRDEEDNVLYDYRKTLPKGTYERTLMDLGFKFINNTISNKMLIKEEEVSIDVLAAITFVSSYLKQLKQHTFVLVPAGVNFVIDLVLLQLKENKDIKKFINDFNKINNKPKKCIKPTCNNIVDPNKKRNGACCSEHTKFYCAKCKCWHNYNSKIANTHLKYKITDWIKDKQERDLKISKL